MNIDNNWKLKAHAIEDTVYPCLFIGSLRAPFMAVMISRNETLHYLAVVSTLLSLSLYLSLHRCFFSGTGRMNHAVTCSWIEEQTETYGEGGGNVYFIERNSIQFRQ